MVELMFPLLAVSLQPLPSVMKSYPLLIPKTLDMKNIKVGNGPHGIRFSKDSKWLYVTVTKDNIVAVINVETMAVEKKIAVGKFPFWIAVPGNL
jgi:YVTN family beta-propeller protein